MTGGGRWQDCSCRADLDQNNDDPQDALHVLLNMAPEPTSQAAKSGNGAPRGTGIDSARFKRGFTATLENLPAHQSSPGTKATTAEGDANEMRGPNDQLMKLSGCVARDDMTSSVGCPDSSAGLQSICRDRGRARFHDDGAASVFFRSAMGLWRRYDGA